ncbi:hypothetical protein V493_02378 [Pseudogymnoascus sp. VKM F-4281 (FW-2241)]|nr:hypothetical protein V493_02378 [Pseudogymnoascus sp. VKM F-4281 (FW-2241)]
MLQQRNHSVSSSIYSLLPRLDGMFSFIVAKAAQPRPPSSSLPIQSSLSVKEGMQPGVASGGNKRKRATQHERLNQLTHLNSQSAMVVINLRDPNAVYAQGDEVVGQVIYHDGTSTGSPVRIVVELVGSTKTKVKVPNGRHYETRREQADILQVTVADIQGTFTVWPFSFCFPATASPLEPNIFDSKPPITNMGAGTPLQPLPPTYEKVAGLHRHLSMWDCFIEYKIRASVLPPGASQPLLQQEIAVNFQPRLEPQFSYEQEDRSREVSEASKSLCAKSLLLLPENKDRKLTLIEKTKSVFQSSKLPYFNFRVVFTQPTRINLAQNIHFTIRVEVSPETSTVPEIPTIKLVYFGHYITGETKAWAGGAADIGGGEEMVFCTANKGMGEFQSAWRYTKTITTPLITHAIPTFKAPNVTRKYVLASFAGVQCAGQTFRVDNKAEVTILPAVRGSILPDTPAVDFSMFKQPEAEWKDGEETPPSQTGVKMSGFSPYKE